MSAMLSHEATPLERRIWAFFQSGLCTTHIAEWMTRELKRPMSEAEAYNSLARAQSYHHAAGTLSKGISS